MPSASGSRSCTSCAVAWDAAPTKAFASCCSRSRCPTLAKARLKVIYENSDGFEIARQDLLIRGPGEFLGARQSGVPLLRFADLERDVALIEQARDAADELLRREPGPRERISSAGWAAARSSSRPSVRAGDDTAAVGCFADSCKVRSAWLGSRFRHPNAPIIAAQRSTPAPSACQEAPICATLSGTYI